MLQVLWDREKTARPRFPWAGETFSIAERSGFVVLSAAKEVSAGTLLH
jgi:hypothetical protein